MRTSFYAWLVWVLGSLAAHADDRIVLLEREGLRPGLCGALRIQLSGLADVRCELDQGDDLLSTRIEGGAARVREFDARLGVLLERDPDPGRVRMYLVSAKSDQAVIAIERIEDRPDPDVDRSLALKVRDAYELVAVVRAAAPQTSIPLSATVAALPRTEVREPLRLFLDTGGGLSFGGATRGVANIVLGLSRTHRAQRAELGVGARLASTREERRTYGRVDVRERGALISARLVWARGRLELGGVLEGIVSFASARGVAADASQGRKTLITPAFALGAEARVRLFPAAYVRMAPVVELALIDRRLSVDDRVLIEDGPARFTLPISLVVSLPLRREPGVLQP